MKRAILLTILILGIFRYANGQHYPDSIIVSSFRQGEAGNCASISVIKSAIQTFGLNGVLKSCIRKETGYDIVLRNRDSLFLSFSDIDLVASVDHFKCDLTFDSTIYNKSRFYYAVMNKYYMKTHLENLLPISQITIHNDGIYLDMNTENNFMLLGLNNNFRDISNKLKSINKYSNVIITSLFHSAYSCYGYFDQYGKPANIFWFRWKHMSWKIWFSSKLRNAYQLYQ